MAAVPRNCTVLVIGGGPAGSFSAAALAREGIDVVVLEAETFPRYHIGESLLPSMREFLKFIDCYDKFNNHGFQKKNGAAFRLAQAQPEAASDFLATGGPEGYAWNVVRSEADELLFKHAGACGAQTFDGTKVESVQFELDITNVEESSNGQTNPGRPVAAQWSRKDGSSGTITFDYIVDASGRRGILSTKYLKNRKFNQTLNNIATWGYWKNAGIYGKGTHTDGYPYFEALEDGSGWCWFIPLHNGTTSVGIVQKKDIATAKKRKRAPPTSKDFYIHSLDQVPRVKELLSKGELVSDIKSASDWSYSAPAYAFPNARIAGDAGCFIDPFFSSGVHLATVGGLSAAISIAASIRGDCDEATAVSWHTKKIAASYTRYFLMVSSAMKQIWSQEEPVIQDIDEEGFQRAFDMFRPVIQGTVDANMHGKITQSEVPKVIEFCFKAFTHITADQKETLFEKLKKLDAGTDDPASLKEIEDIEKKLTPDELEVLEVLRSRRMYIDEGFDLGSFTLDSIDGLAPNMVRGKLGLVKGDMRHKDKSHLYSIDFLESKPSGVWAKKEENGSRGDFDGKNDEGQDANGHEQQLLQENNFGGIEKNGHGANGHAQAHGDSNGVANGVANKVLGSLGGNSAQLDEASRHKVMATLHGIAEDMETPFDMLMRLANAGSLMPMIRVGCQLHVFKSLSASASPLTIDQLAQVTGADPRLVRRVVRYLSANRFVSEVQQDLFTASKTTHYLADTNVESSISVYHGCINPIVSDLPVCLAENGFFEKVGPPCVFNQTVNSDLDFYSWLKVNPDMLTDFQKLMAVPRAGDWVGAIPFENCGPSDRAAFVDVGGNIGHQCAQLKARHPELAGRIVVQDLPETIASAPKAKGIKFMEHDFFTPQPVKGAKYYYFRTIMHNWADDKAAEILRNIVPAMAPDSRILIDEIAMPSSGAHVWPATQDLLMMMVFGARERTVDEWTSLLDKAGLKIAEIRTYASVMRSSIIFAQPK